MHDHQARAVCGASVVGDEEGHRDPDARSSGGDGLRPEVAAEKEIIEEFEPEDEDNREEGEEVEEWRGLRAPLKVSKEQRDARDNAHPISCVVPSLRSGQGPECATQDEDRGAARETGAQSEHGLLLHEPGRREGGQETSVPGPWGRRELARRTKWSGW